jgi:hypothetical protein
MAVHERFGDDHFVFTGSGDERVHRVQADVEGFFA